MKRVALLGLALAVSGCGGASTPVHQVAVSRPVRLRPPAPRPARTLAPRREHPSPHASRPQYRFSAIPLTPALRTLIAAHSWHPGCPVSLAQLRYVRVPYYNFAHRSQLGEMVVDATAVPAVRKAFALLFSARFPIRQMRLVDHYGGSDYASIQADNTSSFNCRNATGSSTWSEHAYGEAIDINPIENPYVYANGTTSHRASRPYLNRSDVRPGMAVAGGTLVDAFKAVGWGWGGNWPLPTDFQHFSVNGR